MGNCCSELSSREISFNSASDFATSSESGVVIAEETSPAFEMLSNSCMSWAGSICCNIEDVSSRLESFATNNLSLMDFAKVEKRYTELEPEPCKLAGGGGGVVNILGHIIDYIPGNVKIQKEVFRARLL